KDPDRVAAYAKLAGPALKAKGAKYLALGVVNEAYEAGIKQRMVIIEWPSLKEAVDAHESPEYQAALKVFDNAAERDFRIIEAAEWRAFDLRCGSGAESAILEEESEGRRAVGIAVERPPFPVAAERAALRRDGLEFHHVEIDFVLGRHRHEG